MSIVLNEYMMMMMMMMFNSLPARRGSGSSPANTNIGGHFKPKNITLYQLFFVSRQGQNM